MKKKVLYLNKIYLISLFFVSLILTLCVSFNTYAEDKYWIGDSDSWTNASAWNPIGIPQTGDNVFIENFEDTTISLLYDYTVTPSPVLESLVIEGYGNGIIKFNQVSVDGGESILYVNNEDLKTGSVYNQDTGIHGVFGTYSIGCDDYTKSATYNLRNGNLETVVENIHGDSTFNQSGGVHTVTEHLRVQHVFGRGTYNLSGGTLSVQLEGIGSNSGPGFFNQSGGSHIVDQLFMGWDGTAIYNLSNGMLDVNYEEMGAGEGEAVKSFFNQTGGTHLVRDLLDFRGYMEYNLEGGALIAQNEIFNLSDWGDVVFNQTGGEHTIIETLHLRINPRWSDESRSVYNLYAGTLTANEIVNEGTINYFGGDINIGTDGSGNFLNIGITNLSGDSVKQINADIQNNGTFNVIETKAYFKGFFTNEESFLSESSEIHFDDLLISENGYMHGNEKDLWYVRGSLLGVITEGKTVTNINGADGMYVYYSASLPANQYLGGLTYVLTGGGLLKPLIELKYILDFFDKSVADGRIVGTGRNPWLAKLRLFFMREMLVIAKELLEQEKNDWACFTLERAYLRCDGENRPPDFVFGEAVTELNDMIHALMSNLGCD